MCFGGQDPRHCKEQSCQSISGHPVVSKIFPSYSGPAGPENPSSCEKLACFARQMTRQMIKNIRQLHIKRIFMFPVWEGNHFDFLFLII